MLFIRKIKSEVSVSGTKKTRCPWPGDDPLCQQYHDEEWGVPVHSDKKLFEFIILEGVQAGLSWITVVGDRPIQNYHKSMKDIPPVTEVAQQISRDMKKRGFTFVGPTIIYAHMQATGMVNDHLITCFRHEDLS